MKKTKKKLDIAKIATEDGFPEFFAYLQGAGNNVAYTNKVTVRVYDSRTGKRLFDYRPRSFSVSPDFINPEHYPRSSPDRRRVQDFEK